jgi:hypothetical protein
MTKAITKFSPEVIKKLQYYVYRLAEPTRDGKTFGKTFYIGKGKGNRIFQHIAEKTKDKDGSLKIETINKIGKKNVILIIHRWGLCETAAFELEAALIDVYESLTNIASGRRSDVSPSTVEQIQETLGIKETAKFEHKVLMIKITQDSINKQKNNIYKAVCEAWKINRENANKVDYVLAVCNGVIKEAFVLTGKKWHESPREAGRYKFEGKPAPDSIQDLYRNKLIPQEYREKNAANPIRYSRNTNSKRGKK